MMRSMAGLLAVILMIGVWVLSASAAPKPDLWPYWQASVPSSKTRIDHTPWQRFLSRYLITDHPSGVNRVRYGAVTAADRKLLENYLTDLQDVHVTGLNAREQLAFWINLYNALTIKVVLDHYPVVSIRDIDISPGFFSNGPWDAKLVRIEDLELSLNDIEHRILRPIWKDNRIHYTVNCASIGCPNLQPMAFTADNTERILDKAARTYVNHRRGANFKKKDALLVSSIYDWFQEDFGNSESGVVAHLIRYAGPPLKSRLESFSGDIDYAYDWTLNAP